MLGQCPLGLAPQELPAGSQGQADFWLLLSGDEESCGGGRPVPETQKECTDIRVYVCLRTAAQLHSTNAPDLWQAVV